MALAGMLLISSVLGFSVRAQQRHGGCLEGSFLSGVGFFGLCSYALSLSLSLLSSTEHRDNSWLVDPHDEEMEMTNLQRILRPAAVQPTTIRFDTPAPAGSAGRTAGPVGPTAQAPAPPPREAGIPSYEELERELQEEAAGASDRAPLLSPVSEPAVPPPPYSETEA